MHAFMHACMLFRRERSRDVAKKKQSRLVNKLSRLLAHAPSKSLFSSEISASDKLSFSR